MDGIGDFTHHLCDFIGETVTIFTTSGGESGAGFTGVVLTVNPVFVRLVTSVGPAPCCALGNSCFWSPRSRLLNNGFLGGDCFTHTVGSVVDIPLDRIAAFVHNAVGRG
jgi:hypothetical protein